MHTLICIDQATCQSEFIQEDAQLSSYMYTQSFAWHLYRAGQATMNNASKNTHVAEKLAIDDGSTILVPTTLIFQQ